MLVSNLPKFEGYFKADLPMCQFCYLTLQKMTKIKDELGVLQYTFCPQGTVYDLRVIFSYCVGNNKAN